MSFSFVGEGTFLFDTHLLERFFQNMGVGSPGGHAGARGEATRSGRTARCIRRGKGEGEQDKEGESRHGRPASWRCRGAAAHLVLLI